MDRKFMKEVTLPEMKLKQSVEQGFDETIDVVVDAIYKAVGGELNGENMSALNANQMTLLAYKILHEEVMDGGFVQLIHNGYGPFIFKNPFEKVLKTWEIVDLAKLASKSHKLFNKYGREIEKDCTDEEFMALFEQFPAFDDEDDEFVENEEKWTEEIAKYVVEHIEQFAKIIKDE